MIRVGVIANPLSRRNRGGGFRAVMESFPHLPRAEPRTVGELAEALTEFRRREVGVIAVSGGDGTIREILTALPAAYGDRAPPDLALLPAGKINLAARVVGSAGGGLGRLVEAARGGRLARVEWPVLDVQWRDDPARRVRGFLFGAAGFAEGTRLAYSHVHRAGVNNAAAVALSIAATTVSTLIGRQRRALMAGEDMRVGVDGGPARGGRRFLILATTLDRLVFGLTPFWGPAEETGPETGQGPLRWLDIAAPPHRLMAAVLPVLRGRPRRWMRVSGYASGRAGALTVELSRPFVVDGELFEPGPRGVLVSSGHRIGFVAPWAG